MLRVLALALATGSAVWPQQPPDYVAQSRRIAKMHVDELVLGWLEATGVPGAAIAIVEGEQTLMLAGYGTADPETGAPIDSWRTVFGAGELVRPFTAMALLQLAERGALDLEVDIATYLPELSLGGRFSQAIGAHHLLTHTAGFDERSIGSRARSRDGILPLAGYLKRFPPVRVRPPGRVSVPSALGFAVAGRLVEKLSGLSFPAYARHHVFEPLGMSSSTVVLDRSLQPRMAIGHRRLADGRDVAVSPDYPHAVAASSLWTTAADMSRWLKVLSNDGSVRGRRLLQRHSVERMLERRFANHERLPGRSLAFREDRRFSPPVLYQAARGGGYSAVALVIAQRRLGLFAAFNREVDFWSLVDRILGLFASRAAAQMTATPAAAATTRLPVGGYWRSAGLSHTSSEKLVSLIRQERIRQLEGGELTWRSRRYRPVAPLVFQQIDGPRLLCFIPVGERPAFAAAADTVLERLHWFQIWPLQVALWLAFAIVFLAASWSRGSMPARSQVFALPSGLSPGWPMLLGRLAASLNFLFIVLVAVLLAGIMLRGAESLLYGIPWPGLLLLGVPLLAAALTAATAVTLVIAWRSRGWTRRQRLRMVVLTLALTLFPVFLHSWRLLGLPL